MIHISHDYLRQRSFATCLRIFLLDTQNAYNSLPTDMSASFASQYIIPQPSTYSSHPSGQNPAWLSASSVVTLLAVGGGVAYALYNGTGLPGHDRVIGVAGSAIESAALTMPTKFSDIFPMTQVQDSATSMTPWISPTNTSISPSKVLSCVKDSALSAGSTVMSWLNPTTAQLGMTFYQLWRRDVSKADEDQMSVIADQCRSEAVNGKEQGPDPCVDVTSGGTGIQ